MRRQCSVIESPTRNLDESPCRALQGNEIRIVPVIEVKRIMLYITLSGPQHGNEDLGVFIPDAIQWLGSFADHYFDLMPYGWSMNFVREWQLAPRIQQVQDFTAAGLASISLDQIPSTDPLQAPDTSVGQELPGGIFIIGCGLVNPPVLKSSGSGWNVSYAQVWAVRVKVNFHAWIATHKEIFPSSISGPAPPSWNGFSMNVGSPYVGDGTVFVEDHPNPHGLNIEYNVAVPAYDNSIRFFPVVPRYLPRNTIRQFGLLNILEY